MPVLPHFPNILLIMTDTSRCDTIGAYGAKHAVSPALDRLASEGVVFTQSHTASPVCMPARCSLMTGTHTPIHGCVENGVSRRDHLTMMTDLLDAQGYVNLIVGKAHFGRVPSSFHVQHILAGEKSAEVDDFYGDHIRAHGYSRASRHPNPVPPEVFCDAFLVDTMIESLETVVDDGGRPFFGFCSLLSPHAPLDPPGDWATLFDERSLPPVNYVSDEQTRQPLHTARLLGLADGHEMLDLASEGHGPIPVLENGEPDWEYVDRARRLYYGLAAYCDAQIGRLLRWLDAKGLTDETLVIFTSDHGQQYWDHGFNDKHNFFDESWRVPLIMRYPGVIPEGVVRSFAVGTDVTATILGAAGIDWPAVQGFNLLESFNECEESPRKCAVAHLYQSCAFTTANWKVEYFLETGRGRLWNRVLDPREQVDLWDSPVFVPVRDQMVVALLGWRSDLIDVEWLQSHSSGGGPVARRATAHTATLRGTDAECRLNQRALSIDERYPPNWGS